MEPIEIFDSVNNKHINVYVSSDVAEKCRTDNAFAEDLFNKLQDQDIEEGSFVEIETIKTEAEDGSLVEEKIDKETWSRRETLKFIKVFQKYKDKFNEYRQKKAVWSAIASELNHLNVYKTPEKCAEKWKNLLRTYKHTNGKPCTPTRFQFYQEMKDIFSNTQVTISDTDSDGEIEVKYKPPTSGAFLDLEFRTETIEKESWSKHETLKLLRAFQKHKTLKKNFTKEKQFWGVISAELAKDNIHKAPEKCATKWKNLYRSYKKNIDKPAVPTRFQYFQEVCDVINDVELNTSEHDMNITDGDFEEIVESDQNIAPWAADETLKLINAYKKHKHRFMKCPNRKYFWTIIASELASEDIHRDSEKCENKWKSLTRSFKRNSMSGDRVRFYFYDEMSKALNDDDLNDGEVTTTQNDMLLEYDNMDSSDINDSDDISKAEVVESEGNDDTEDMTYEEIIIETEPDKADDLDKYWSYNETAAFLKAYAAHSKQFKEVKRKTQIWEAISEELDSHNVHKAPDICEKKWRSMFSVYKTHKLNKTGPGKFTFYKEMDDILKDRIDLEDIDRKVAHKKNCNCMEKRLIDKQKRHIERMQLLKRKLDIEERKVEAFEDYVRHMKGKGS